MKQLITDTVAALDAVSAQQLQASHACLPPDRREVVRVVKALQALLFPLCFRREHPHMSDEALLESTARDLTEQLAAALRFQAAEADPVDLCDRFLLRLAEIKRLLLLDVEALYEGDPAAVCREELRSIPVMLEAVQNGTSALGWRIADRPALDLPAEYAWLLDLPA
mgnify:CR=1 FL=1